ncbi:SIR2 family protein [Vibrio parahaemolyticus]|uniref:SIR2 family protein n=1 Tax=Vibrio parahaemolyticus TaxID=670 RepID=UPI001E3A603E|nr:SIR2 family protein [Vibrio parahaemolyticus]
MNMDYLKSAFNEELNSDGGVVEIAGSEFERCEILNGLEPETYEIAFNEWLAEKQELLLEKACEILDIHDNKARFEQLVRVHKAGSLVPFIGAGLSIPSGYPSWTAFLYQCCEESDTDEADLTKLLSDGLYEEAAQLLHDDMTAPVFNELLDATFDVERDIEGAIHYLPYLFNDKHVITTNFDLVLERVYESKGKAFEAGSVKSGKSLTEVTRYLQTKPRSLIKIHGTSNQVADRVLLHTEYETTYQNSGDVSNFFERVIFKDSLLFLGASLNADRTIKKMEEIVTEKGHVSLPRNYAFLELKSSENRIERKQSLARANIFPIWYPEGEHDESIEALLYKLMKDCE